MICEYISTAEKENIMENTINPSHALSVDINKIFDGHNSVKDTNIKNTSGNSVKAVVSDDLKENNTGKATILSSSPDDNFSNQCYLTKKDVANLLQLKSIKSVENLMKQGLPYLKLGNTVRVRNLDLTKFLELYRIEN